MPPAVTPDEQALLAAWRAGDVPAGQALFRRHYVGLVRFFRSKAGEAAYELTQATFLACVEGRGALREPSSFPAYLYAIARNILYDHYRGKHHARQTLEFSELSSEELSPGQVGVRDAEQELDLLLRAMRRIPVNAQIMLELYYWERMTAREIGEVLGVPEGTVRTRIRDAKQHVEAQVARLARSPELAHSTVTGFDTWAERLRQLVGRGAVTASG
jgi:RNA polymerase sigma factor (sigma-70 family)